MIYYISPSVSHLRPTSGQQWQWGDILDFTTQVGLMHPESMVSEGCNGRRWVVRLQGLKSWPEAGSTWHSYPQAIVSLV